MLKMDKLIELHCKCGKLLKVPKERAGQSGNCSACGAEVSIPIPLGKKTEPAPKKDSYFFPKKPKEATPKAGPFPVAKPVVAKPQARKISVLVLFYLILAFLLGLFVGVVLGPEYLNLLPARESLLPMFGRNEGTLPSLEKIDTRIEPVKNTAEASEQKTLSESYLSQKPQLDRAMQNVQAYTTVLEKEIEELKKQKALLEMNYQVSLSEEAQRLLQDAKQNLTSFQERIQYSKNIYERERWDLIPKAYGYLKKYETIQPSTDQTVQRLRAETQKGEELLSRARAYSSKTTVAAGTYLGSWYKNLLALIAPIKSVCATRGGARMENIKASIQKCECYATDIDEIAQQFLKLMNQKDVHKWIQQRKATALSGSQKRQYEIVESFLQSGQKFEVDLLEEMRSLENHVGPIQTQAAQNGSVDEIAREILAVLRQIDRKYQESYEAFHSALLLLENFEG